MMIPATPVRRKFNRQLRTKKDVMQKPFDYLLGKQAVFSCAREALLYGIRLLKHRPGRVHIPAYCCRSILSPIEKMGLEISFYDVGDHLEPIVKKAELNDGDVFVLVHYFGIPQDTSSIADLCKEFNMVLVEDCAHTLPDPGTEHPMGSKGAFSVYSVRKLLPVPDGGILVINDRKMQTHINDLVSPRVRRLSMKRWVMTSLDRFAFNVGWPNTQRLKDSLRNIIGSTDNFLQMQLSDEAVPGINSVTLRVLGLVDFKDIIAKRRKNYRYLSDRLSEIAGLGIPFSSLPDGAVPQAFPVKIENADEVCSHIRKKGITVGRWPGADDLPDTVIWSDFPGAFSWIRTLVLLPAHQDLNDNHLDKMVYVLSEKSKRLI